uniref:Uncharacterized protein n=1 Tax=Aegilops tauschii subsp. strangulata TaxID=200361 RepID=A0A453KWJ6_AEGTS
MLEEEHGAMGADGLAGSAPERGGGWAEAALEPVRWVRMLCRELGATFVAGVVLVYGLNQGFAGSFFRVASDYYWKDVQRVQPATVQFLSIFFHVPWVLKPLWGVMTDVFPVRGYRRRPYFVFSGQSSMNDESIHLSQLMDETRHLL